LVIQNRHNTITSTLLRSNMKEIDDTPIMKTESERNIELMEFIVGELTARIKELEAEVADLHHRREVAREQADDTDPEWY
jgi:uncharacterized protein YceH (UPF0502 family)